MFKFPFVRLIFIIIVCGFKAETQCSNWQSIYGFHDAGCCYFEWTPKHEKSVSTSNPEKQLRHILVTYLWIVPQIWGCTLRAESVCLQYDVEVFQKCLEICEIGVESRWMLRNVSEMVDAFGKETLAEHWFRNAPRYQLFVWMECGRDSVGDISTYWLYIWIKSRRGVLHHLNW